ncbi:MAG: ABC transporter ATP-binding protein [Pirellulales bacterium]|nr:ABC transporter ATP-binding protein [Pirellulales bacterium]
MRETLESRPAIQVADAHHRFKDHCALQGITFDVASRSLHGFVGPNGAGKTTTLKLLCTLLEPQRGHFRVLGHDIRQGVQRVRRRIGFMPDHMGMYRQMTVFEYLDFFAAAYGLAMSSRDSAIRDVLELTDLAGRRDSMISGLSRGMQQRVSLARVLVSDPEVLLLDEPASGLDPRARIELMEILRELRRMGKTVFISSHILSELADLCDSVTIIDRGKIKYSGSMDKLLDGDGEQRTFRVTTSRDDENITEKLATLADVATFESLEKANEFQLTAGDGAADSNLLLQRLIEAGVHIEAFAPQRRHLNDAFLDLTEEGVR